MPNRSAVMLKILRSTVCPEENKKDRVAASCFDLQSQLSHSRGPQEIPCSNVQTGVHPPVQRLYRPPDNRTANRFAQELFFKYPFMMPKIERAIIGTYGSNSSPKSTYRGEYRNPKDVVEELQNDCLVRTGTSSWRPEERTARDPHAEYRSVQGYQFTEDQWGSRLFAKQKLKDEVEYQRKKKIKLLPWESEYNANINSMGQFIMRKDIFRKEKVLVRHIPTLPE